MLLVIGLNVQLFQQPIAESSDYAANSLLVQQAEHFKLLTGHYSRWGFHHPGPAYLYVFALGEFLFYDLLHVVPAPFNGQLLIVILFNGALLAATLCVFRRHARLPVPAALVATLVVAVMVNASGRPSVLVSNWMPDVLLFPFLLFAVSAASVLAGETHDLRYLAVSGMLLIHGHFAQFLFVGVMGGATVGYMLARAQRQGRLRALLAERRRDFAVAAAIVLVLALPPLLEIALDRPNNLDDVLAYERHFGAVRNSVGLAIGYFACFLLFVSSPETAVTHRPVEILAYGFSRPQVMVYWVALALLFAAAVVAWRKTAHRKDAAFLGYLAAAGAASALLFIYWSTRIAGGLYAFNGMFIYALHVLAWFVLLAVVAPLFSRRAMQTVNVAALVVLAAFGILERKTLRSAVANQPAIPEAAAAVPAAPFGKLALTFDLADWQWATGVANSMERLGKPFCVGQEWGFMFSRSNVCPDMLAADRLWLRTAATSCTPPCRYVYRSRALSLTRSAAQWLTLPVEVGLEQSAGLDRSGFNEAEGPHRWLQKHATIRFRLAPEHAPAPCFRIALTGFAFPERPTQLAVNGRILGTLTKSVPDTAWFVVPREDLHLGEINRISLDTEKAGPVGADQREIGFGFVSLDVRAAGANESCVADPAAPPDYDSISIDWTPGCYGPEGAAAGQWRWCGPDSQVVIHNTSTQPRRLTLSAGLSTGYEKAAPLRIRSPFFEDTVAVSSHRLAYSRTFTVPPGDHTIVFTCRAPRLDVRGDPRDRVLRVDGFQLSRAANE